VYPPFYGRKELLVPIFKNGRLEYMPPDLKAIQDDCRQNLEHLGLEFKRLGNPARYPVHLSRSFKNQKKEMLKWN
jgi:nicotinate phosphoribosyltransferase